MLVKGYVCIYSSADTVSTIDACANNLYNYYYCNVIERRLVCICVDCRLCVDHDIARARVRACARACVHARARARARVRVYLFFSEVYQCCLSYCVAY